MKKALIISLSLLSVVTLSACSSEEEIPQEDPQAVLDKAWEQMADRNTEFLEGEVSFEGNIEIENSKTEDKGDLEASGKLSFDNTDIHNQQVALELDLEAEGSVAGESGKVDLAGELRLLDEELFVLLKDLDLETDELQTKLVVNYISNVYKDQWISLPLGDSLNIPELEGTEEEQEELAKTIREKTKQHKFLEVEEVLAARNYKVVINPEKFKQYIQAMAEVTQTPLDPVGLAAIEVILGEKDNYELSVRIDDNNDFSGFNAEVNFQNAPNNQNLAITLKSEFDGKETDLEGTIDLTGSEEIKVAFDLDTEHVKKEISIEKPESQSLDLSGALPFGGGELGVPTQ